MRRRLAWSASALLFVFGLGLVLRPDAAKAAPGLTVATSKACLATTSDTIALSNAVTAGDDLVLLVSGQGYGAAAPTVTGVSDTVNGTWTALVNDQSLTSDHTHYLSYAVYHFNGSAAAAQGLTVTVHQNAGQTAASAVLLDIAGPVTEDTAAFNQGLQTASATLSSPTATVPSGDLAVGLFGAYAYGQTFTVGSGWTLDKVATSCTRALAESQVTGTAGQLAASIKVNGSTNYIGGVLAFSSNTAPTAPGVPSNVAATAGNAAASLSWTAPGDNGSAITGYEITPYIASVAQPAILTGGTATTYTVTGLNNGTAYTFRVAATNAIGTGSQSAQTNAVTPSAPTAPTAPTAVSAVAGNGSVAVTWTAPADNGGSAITGYQITPYISGTAQTAVNTSATSTTYSVTGLTNGTDYTFAVAAINAVGIGAQSAQSSIVTPNASTTAIKPMPVISHGLPTYGDGNVLYSPSDGTSGTYGSGSASYLCGPPCGLIIDLSSVPVAQRQQVVVAWYNDETNYYAAAINNSYYNEPRDYTIGVSNAPGGSNVPTTWTTLASVTGNFYNGREHVLNLNGANWIRMEVTAVNGSSGNADASFDLDVHDASQGNNDSWLVLGDSITQDDMGHYEPSNFMQQVNAAYPGYFPVQFNGGVGGWDSGSPLQTDPRTGQVYMDEFLAAFPGHFVSVDYGTNDANEGGPALASYLSNMRTLINKIIAAGKVPVLRQSIPWGCTANILANGPTVNADLAQLLAEYPQAVAGPDEWSYFKANPSLIGGDCIHPTIGAGNAAYRQVYVQSLISGVYKQSN